MNGETFDRLIERRIGLGISIPESWRHGVVRSEGEYRVDAGPQEDGALPRMTLLVHKLADLPIDEIGAFDEWAVRRRLDETGGELDGPPEREGLLTHARINYAKKRHYVEELYLRAYDRLGWELRFKLDGRHPPREQLDLVRRLVRGANLDIRRPVPPPEVPEDAALFFDGHLFDGGKLEVDSAEFNLQRFVNRDLGLAMEVPEQFIWSDDSDRERWGVKLDYGERNLTLKYHVYSSIGYGQSMYVKMLTRRLSQQPGMQVRVGPVLPSAFGGIGYLQVVDAREDRNRFIEHYVFGAEDRLYHIVSGQDWPVDPDNRELLDAVVRSTRFFQPGAEQLRMEPEEHGDGTAELPSGEPERMED